MTSEHTTPKILLAAITVLVMLTGADTAHAAEPPIKEVLSAHFGAEVNLTAVKAKAGPAQEDLCTIASHDECQAAKTSSKTGGFDIPEDVAGGRNGDIYVADGANHRVQELTDAGAFVAMFGWDVNATKEKEGAPQSEQNICTAASGDTCQAGVEGTAPGQLDFPSSLAVDPVSGDLYVAETIIGESSGEKTFGERIQKFSPEGQFLLEIGKEVNETTKGNLCTQVEVDKLGVKCKGPKPRLLTAVEEVHEPSAFAFYSQGNILAVGGPENELYVGDEHRVQEFEASGNYKAEVSLTSISSVQGDNVTAIVAGDLGEVFLTYGQGSGLIREFDPAGKETASIYAPGLVGSMALSSSGLAVAGIAEANAVTHPFGLLYDTSTLRPITKFMTKENTGGLGFNEDHELYAVSGSEVVAYAPLPVAEPVTGTATCMPGSAGQESDVTLDCDVSGEVNPWGVADTEAWFRWGATGALGSETSKQVVCAASCGSAAVPVSGVVEGLRPNQTLFYQLNAYDVNNGAPEEPLASSQGSITTPIVPAEILGESSASYIHFDSAVLYGELNPENAPTAYQFEYGACEGGLEGCQDVARTEALESDEYGRIATTLEATGLQPDTTYHYRLIAQAAGPLGGDASKGSEGAFTTAPAPVPQAATGAPGAVAATSATVSGMVDPDGEPATYAFELGVYAGAQTEYGTVLSASAGASSVPVEESFGLSGLQPGTTYAYRITIASGYGTVTGEPVLFTTAGLPAVLTVTPALAQLAVPAIVFPVESKVSTTVKKTVVKCAKNKHRSHGRCVKSTPKRKAKGRKSSRARKSDK